MRNRVGQTLHELLAQACFFGSRLYVEEPRMLIEEGNVPLSIDRIHFLSILFPASDSHPQPYIALKTENLSHMSKRHLAADFTGDAVGHVCDWDCPIDYSSYSYKLH